MKFPLDKGHFITEMPFTAKYVIEHYLKVGYKTDEVYGGIADGEKVIFTKMPEF